MRRYMNDMKTKIACIIITTLFLMSSCSSEKEVMRSNLRAYNANHLVREINENSFDYESLQTKLDIKFKDERNSLGLKGQLRMQKDSLIWISLSMKLGIEVARVMVTNDSIKFINRSNRTYLSESLDNVKEMLPIDASMSYIQNILVGNDSQLKRSDRYKTSIDNDLYKLESSRDGLLMKQLWIIPETFRISRYEINSISLLYDKFDNIDGKILPKKIIFETNDSSNIKIEIDYSEIKTEEKLDFPFNISKKYNKINL